MLVSLLLIIPLLSIPVFWLAPVSVGFGLYALMVMGCLVVYFYLVRLGRRQTHTLKQMLVGRGGTVAQVMPYLRVRVDGEYWSARSIEPLQVGDTVVIYGLNGLRARVRKPVLIEQEASRTASEEVG